MGTSPEKNEGGLGGSPSRRTLEEEELEESLGGLNLKDDDRERNTKPQDLVDIDAIPETEKHPIKFEYVMWFNRRLQGARTQENYEKNIKKIGSFKTIEDFWSYYGHLVRPNDLPNSSDYLLFKKGIRPIWEDEYNAQGGKWIVRLQKRLASRYWEDLVLAVLGEQFNVGEEICGIVISIRFQEDIISVWNRNADNQEAKLRILQTLKRVLALPPTASVEYKRHDISIRDNSSFRNTESFRIISQGGTGGSEAGGESSDQQRQPGGPQE